MTVFDHPLDNMVEQINQILNDPDSLKQIREIASGLGLDQAFSDEGQPSQIMQEGLAPVLSAAKAKEEKHQALMHALLPYLKPRHQQRLERAVQIAKLSNIARAAINSGIQQNLHSTREDEHDV